MKNRTYLFLRTGTLLTLIIVFLTSLFRPQFAASAAAVLTVTPITWNVIGLDSNNVNVGPNHFPIGARVCNTGDTASTNVTANFVWDSANALINNRPGTLTTISVASLAPTACTDVYFEVQVTRNAAAYDTTRNYHISVTADGGLSASTPTPRALYVEHLVSQSRNAVTDVRVGTTLASLALPASSVPAGGTMNLMVGNTYYIRMIGFTATQGYEQLESFINIPNTIFQVLSVNTTYTADTSATVSSPNDKLYGDACRWENDPGSPNYRACLDVGKVGGDIQVTYQVRILQVPGAPLVNPQPLSTLIYDFSGSSFHYNSDYGISTRYAYIINASVTKSFSPKTILPGGTSTLTFTISNPGTASISNLNFTDDLPANMSLSNATVNYTGCGASPLPASVSDPMSFSNITVAGNSTCTIAVTVTASTAGTYNNVTGNLFIDTTNTGSSASDTLVVSSQTPPPSSCTTPVTFATWSMPTTGQGSGGPPPPYTTRAANVTTTTASSSGGTFTIAADGSAGVNSWSGAGWASSGTPGPATTPYFEFIVDTSNYGAASISFDYIMTSNGDWASASNNLIYVHTRADNGAFTSSTAFSTSKGSWVTPTAGTFGITYAAPATGTGTTTFRINAVGAQNATGELRIDDVTFTGCARPTVPNLSKSFAPTSIGTGTTSTLTFTLTNPNAGTSLTGVSFSDILPAGLTVASSTSAACSGGTLTLTAPRTISLTNGTIAASGTCTINVTVTGAAAGTYPNVSSSISSTATGPNTTASGIGTATLTVLDPPVIAKSFTANPIFTSASTALTFSIQNPNTGTALTGVNFTDNLPAGLTVTNPNGLSNTCGGTATATAGSGAVSLSGVTLAAGASCTLTVNVTGSTAGLQNNSVTVGSTEGGTGNTSTASVLVKNPSPGITLLKQVGSTAAGPWSSFLTVGLPGNVFYRLVVENTGDVALSGVNITDPNVNVASCVWTDGNGTALTAPFNLPVANADDDQIAICVLGPIAAVSGSHTNTAQASGTNGTTVVDTSSATYGTPALTLDKTVTQTSFTNVGDLLNYSYLVTNSGAAPLLGPVTVTDNKATVTCPAVSTVGDGDNWLEPADYPTPGTAAESLTCTATYSVTNADLAAGSVTNTASATASGVTSNSDNATVNGQTDMAITKTDGASAVNANGTTTYTVRVTNNGPSNVTGAILSDPVAAGIAKTVVACSGTPGQCSTAPTIAQLEGGTFALPLLTAGQFYEITVTANVTVTSGSVTNTATVALPGGGTDSNNTNNTAADTNTVTPVADLSITKTDGAATINAGGSTFYTVRVTNNGPSAVTGAVLSDPAVAGLSKTAVVCSAAPGQCVTAPTVAELESGTFALPALANGQFYEITVTATVTAGSGSVTNTATIAPPAGTTDPDNTDDSASDTNAITPVIDLSLDKQVSSITPTIGGAVTFTLVVNNAGPSTATNIVITDVVPDGYSYVAASITGGDASDDTNPSTTGLTWTINSLSSGGSVSLTYQATVLAAGPYDNYAEITTHTEGDSDSTAGNGQQTPDEDDDDTQVVTPVAIVAPAIAKAFSPNPISLGETSTLTFTITNPNASVASTGVAFTDALPAGLQVAAAPTATTTGCGAPTFAPAAGNTTLTLSNGTVAANGTCTVTVNVTATTAGTKNNTTGNVTSTNGGTGNTASASLGVINAVKTVVATSEDSSSEAGTPRAVLIGEVVRYHLVMELPEGTTTNLQIEDILVGNLAFMNDNTTRVAFVCNSGAACASSSTAGIGTNPVIAGVSGAVTPTFVLPAANISGDTGNPYSDGVNPVFSLGTVTNNDNDSDAEYVVVEFNILVRNTPANQEPVTRGNNFTVLVNGSSLITSTDTDNSRITITEPVITAITKSVATAPTDAGDAIEYQLQFTNSGTAPAFDITVTDTLNAVLTGPVSVSGSTTGGNCGSTVSTVSGSYTAPTVTATVTCLAAGGTATVNITANVSNTALAGLTFGNTANLVYTSLPGTGSAGNPTGSVTPGASGTGNGERNGSGGTDNYTAASNTVNTTLASPTLAKAINPAGTSYAIGSTIPYQITITVPEGVAGGPAANLVETIPTGLSYVTGSITVTPQVGLTIGAVGPYTDANAGFFNLTGQTMTLTFGSFTSTASAAATNRTVTVAFLARVDNVVGNQSGTSFTNTVDLVRTNPNGVGTLTLTASDASASVIEPDLTVDKSVNSATPAPNSTLTYTLEIEHSGASNAPAYDVHILDTLPAGLTALNNVNVTSAGNCATGVINDSTASVLEITIGTVPLGCVVSITYDVTVSGAVGSNQTNSVAADWTSQSGTIYERTGVDGPGGTLDDYAAIDSEPVTISGHDFSVLKTDGSATYTPGTAITYSITVNNDGNTSATGTVVDTFDAALTNISWTCTGIGLATCTASGTGDINDVVSVPAGESVIYTVDATVLSSATGNLVNTATATLSAGTDPTPGNNSSTDTDTSDPQADLEITKDDGVASVNAGASTTYTIRVTNNGPSDVTGAILSDPAAVGLSKTAVACSATPGQCVTAPTVAQLEGGAFVLPVLASGEFYEITVTATVTAANGNVTNTATVAAPAGTTDPDNTNDSATDTDVVIAPLVYTISGQVRYDADNDGDLTDTENGLAGADIALYTDPNGDGDPSDGVQVGTTITTDGTGAYSFANLPAGNYVVVETNPANYFSTADASGPNDDRIPVVITNADSPDMDFLDSNVRTVSGQVRFDADNDGDLGDADAGLAGAQISIFTDPNGDGDPADGVQVGTTITTDGTGNFSFPNIPPGDYVIVEVNPAGYTSTGDSSAPNDDRIPVVVTNSNSGSHAFLDTNQFSVSGQVRYDVDGDGDLAELDNGLAGAAIALYTDPNGDGDPGDGVQVGADITTNGTGNYSFSNVVPGNYVIVETNPAGYTSTADSSAPNDDRVPVVVTNANSTDNAFLDTIYSAIGDSVFLDDGAGGGIAGNGIQDGGEAGIAGITVYVDLDGSGTFNAGDLSDTTDGNGNYSVANIPPGTYDVSVFNPPAGLNLTTGNDPTNITLAAGATNNTLDFGYIGPRANLSLDKSVSDPTPLVATDITFTIDVTNSGPDAATNVEVTDVIPSGFAYVSDDSAGAYDSNTGVWTVGNLAINQTASLTITVTVNITGSYTNYAEIGASDLVDPNSTPGDGSNNQDDDDSVTVTPTQNDPDGLSKTISSSNQVFTLNADVAIGEIVEYEVAVTIPPGTFNNARLVDTMQRGLSFMDCTNITDNGLTTSVAGGFTSICSTPTVDDAGGGAPVDVGRRVTFDFGALTNNTGSDQQLIVVYRAVVLDSAGNVSGRDLDNRAAWNSDAGSLTPETETVTIVEPELSISKTANVSIVSIGTVVTFTLTIQHTGDSETNAYDTLVTDTLPSALQYVAGSLDCTTGAQDADVSCTESGGVITAAWSNFALGGGDGRITFQATVTSLPTSGISNTANVAWSSLPGTINTPQNSNQFSTERDYDPPSQVDIYGVSSTLVLNNPNPGGSSGGSSQGVGSALPDTGFAPNVVTDMSHVPYETYAATGDVTVEIPSLGVKIPVVGVPKKNGTWNVSWLVNQAGWLEGTAFPSWNGNSVLTSHVYLSNGLPGPFINLSKLKFGDRIVIHAYGQKYTFEVQENKVVQPNDTSALKHEEKPWVTLITCKEYDAKTNTYKQRVVVRAVLVRVDWE